MKPKKVNILSTILIIGFFTNVISQNATMVLTFTAEDNGNYVSMDSILIENLSQTSDTTLYSPDTVFAFDYLVNIENTIINSDNDFYVSQNYPNPYKEKTVIDLVLPEKENITIVIRNLIGQILVKYEETLNKGKHSFSYYSGSEKYCLLTVIGEQVTKTIKMVNANYNSSFEKSCRIEYTKYDNNLSKYKSHSATNDFIFSGGDILKYTAYSNIGERSIFDSPEYDQTIIFQFALGIPCPETPIVNYEGQAYNTVLIGNQCWLKENLNVGTLIGGNIEMSDNGAIEKYCYENNPINCDTYGGLYQWDEMMEYSNIQGTQGICPPGWHIPTDDELKILEGTVDSQFPVGDPAWNHLFDRGHDAGLNLKSTSGWYSGGCGFDLYCFTFLPSGSRHYNGFFVYLVSHGGIWTSSEYNTENAWRRSLNYEDDGVIRYFADKNFGHSIRCLKD